MLRFLWKLRYLLWLALPGLIWWAWHAIPLQQIWEILSGLGLLQLFVLALINLGLVSLFSMRWWLILRSFGHSLPYLSLVGYRLAGFGISYFTPGPQFGGEPLQAYLLHQRQEVPGPTAVASVTLDKMLELLANFSFLFFGLVVILESRVFGQLSVSRFLPVVLGLAFVPFGYLLALWVGWRPIANALGWLAGNPRLQTWLCGTSQAACSVEEQAACFCRENMRVALAAYFFSLVIWGCAVGEYGLCMRFLGNPLSFPQAVAALTAARLAFLLPLPGGVGVLEASQVLALNAMGMAPAYGAGIAVLIRLRDMLLAGFGLGLGALLVRSVPLVEDHGSN